MNAPSLCADRLGTGAAVVLLHGVGGRRAIWGATGSGTSQRVAEAGFEAIALDLPGYGETGTVAVNSIAAMAQNVLDWLKAQGLADAVFVGHSMGGMVAQEVAAQQPQRVRALVLVCTSPAFGRADGSWQAAFVHERLAPLDQGQTMAQVAQRLVPGMLGPHANARALSTATSLMASVNPSTYRAAVRALVGFDRRSMLSALTMPVLCLAGAQDPTAPPEVMRKMAQRIAGAEYTELPGAGHLANLEHPDVFNDLLVSFLERRCRSLPGASSPRSLSS